MSAWRPTCARPGAPTTTATTSTSSRCDGGNSAWAWSAAVREEDGWADGCELDGAGAGDGSQRDPWWEQHVADPWSANGTSDGSGEMNKKYGQFNYDGWLDDEQMRMFNVAQVEKTTAASHGRWQGDQVAHGVGSWNESWSNYDAEKDRGKPTEKLVVPEFDGEGGSDHDLGRSARSYLRKIQVWLRCTKLPAHQRALALYNGLSGKAWIYAEELDVDKLATENGVSYFLQWVQTRFMEVEVSKVAQLMTDLFKRGRWRSDQTVRDFNVEFERMVLRLTEIQCHVPPLIKAWLYLDKLRLNEQEELALLSSVNNEYDCKKLQHAALVQDRAIRRPGAWGGEDAKGVGKRWTRQSVHMTTNEGGELSSEDEKGDGDSDDGEIVDEDTAVEHYTAYMTYQGAKAKYKEVLKGRGVDQHAVDKRNQERLRLAKQRSYCSACKRRGHWHKDPECPLRQRPSTGTTSAAGAETVQSVNFVHQCFVTDSGVQALDEPYMTDYELVVSPCLCLRQLPSAMTEYDMGASPGLCLWQLLLAIP